MPGSALRAFPDFWKRESLLVSSISRFLEVRAGTGELLVLGPNHSHRLARTVAGDAEQQAVLRTDLDLSATRKGVGYAVYDFYGYG